MALVFPSSVDPSSHNHSIQWQANARRTKGKNAARRSAIAGALEALEHRLLFSTYTVTTLTDGPGVVTPVSPDNFTATTLRGAIAAANADAVADVIVIDPALTGSIALDPVAGELAITQSLSIQGGGADRQAVDGGGAIRVFSIATGVTASISDLTVSGGKAVNFGGGGIRNLGTLKLEDCAIQGNTVTGADGGGVFNSGTLTATGSTFNANHADDSSGGGLFSNGSGKVTNCTFFGNSADFGGGAYNADMHTLLFSDCTLSLNHAITSGGGVAGPVNDPVNTPAGTTFNNTVVAGNTFGPSVTGLGPDLFGFFDSASAANLIGAIGFAKGMDPAKNQLGSINNATPAIDAMLGAPGNNGGPTQTLLPQPLSPLIDVGNNTLIPTGVTKDQRGSARIANVTVDIGAVETPAPLPSSLSGCVFVDLNHNGEQDGGYGLGQAAGFALLQLTNTTGIFSKGKISGNLGVGPGSTFKMSGKALVTGSAAKDPTASIRTSGGAKVTGGIVTQSMSQAVADALAASTAASALAATQTFATVSKSATISGNGALNVINVAAIHLDGSKKLTLHGSAADVFIINVPGDFSLSGKSGIALAGGLTANHVLFNVIGNTGEVQLTGSSRLSGTLLIPSRDIDVAGNSLVTGAVIDGHRVELSGKTSIVAAPFSAVTEPCLAGVTITLTGTDVLGHAVQQTTITTNAGYRFDHLLAGSYTLTETQPAGYLDGPDFLGSLGGTLGNDVISNIPLAAGQDGTHYDFSELPITVGPWGV